MLESAIEKKVTQYAAKLGWLSYKFTSTSCKSVPDRIYIRDGLTIFVEFKQEGKKPTPLQLKTHENLRKFGATVVVIDSIESGKNFFDDFNI